MKKIKNRYKWNLTIISLCFASWLCFPSMGANAATEAAEEMKSFTTTEEELVVYPEAEWADRISDTKTFIVTEQDSGEQQEVSFPLLWTEYGDYVWKDGFEFPITVENWDADFYLLGDSRVPKKEVQPFEGYEDVLLAQLGLDGAYYRIFSTEWVSEAYEEQGIWYRQAVAKGEKLVADLTAAYGGMVTWTPKPEPAEEAVPQEETVEVVPEETEAVTLSLEETLWEEPVEIIETSGSVMDMLYRLLSNSKIVSISILFFLLLIASIFILIKYYKKHKNMTEIQFRVNSVQGEPKL